jgi:hypothetical protein
MARSRRRGGRQRSTRHPSLADMIWKELQTFAHARAPAYDEIRRSWTRCAYESDTQAVAALADVVCTRVGCSAPIAAALMTRLLRPRQYQRLLHEAPEGAQPYFTDVHGRSSFWRHG